MAADGTVQRIMMAPRHQRPAAMVRLGSFNAASWLETGPPSRSIGIGRKS
jgi:hypothetical protein